MNRKYEIGSELLINKCDPDSLGFNDTSEVSPYDGIIGQDRAVRAMEFGLRIHSKGYNIFMCGPSGTGKTSYASAIIKELASSMKAPDDWCYVYNFDKPSQPTAINLPKGLGKEFKSDMDKLVKVLPDDITKAFDNEEYERHKALILKDFTQKRNKLIDKLSEDAQNHGFKVKETESGIYFLPIINGKVVDKKAYDKLDEEVKKDIDEKTDIVQLETNETIRKIKNIDREADQVADNFDKKTALDAIEQHLNDLKDKYSDNDKVMLYLSKLREDIANSFYNLIESEEPEEAQSVLLPLLGREQESPLDKYKVNLFVDNSSLEGSPVIVDYNPTYANLIGRIEYENEFGSVSTDYTKIKAGLLHQSNGGFLILQATDVLNNSYAWEALKRVLKTKSIQIENMKEQTGTVVVSTLKPEPIPVDVKLVLIGSPYIYHGLFDYDEDFAKLFKIKVDFDYEMDRNSQNIQRLSGFIASFCRRENITHFEKTAVAAVIDHCSRLVEHQKRLTTRLNDISEILLEASAWAKIEKAPLVTAEHVNIAIKEKIYRSNKYDRKLLEYLQDGTLILDTSGNAVGQINGLTILDMGDYAFGKPTRITATTYMGESGIINIEREVEMSGTSHSKGVLILSGYIGQKFAQDMPLALSASLCFEQLYDGVDGDSASSAELYCILSSLSEVPIKQSIAVTGSVNQKGEIQPIGGVNEKIEGFFELCKLRGLDGSHGVIIPARNKDNLMLQADVVRAVEEGKFHIYAIEHIDQGMEILTGKVAGEQKGTGIFESGSINDLVQKKLRKFSIGSNNKNKTVEK